MINLQVQIATGLRAASAASDMIAEMSVEKEASAAAAKWILTEATAGDYRALSRALSLVENGGPEGAAVITECEEARRALRIGITGAPGAGKSTLVNRMAKEWQRRGRSVAVVAVDPTSPVTGGALLGDRIRMQEALGEGIYVRSVALRGAKGGVPSCASDMFRVLERAGRDVILIETVGVGQSEIDVTRLVDATALVLVPGMGDEVQSLKAGVMEVADVFVVNKADRPGAEEVEREVREMQSLGEKGGWTAPVMQTVATTGQGTEELVDAVEQVSKYRRATTLAFHRTAGDVRLDHLGIAVKSIAQARRFYEALGLAVSAEEVVEHEKVRTAMLPLEETRLELLEPTEENSVIGRFLAKRGEGLHHVAIHVVEIDGMFARLRESGIRLASDSVRVGAGGHRYFFVHPESAGGVLVEIVGDGSEGAA